MNRIELTNKPDAGLLAFLKFKYDDELPIMLTTGKGENFYQGECYQPAPGFISIVGGSGESDDIEIRIDVSGLVRIVGGLTLNFDHVIATMTIVDTNTYTMIARRIFTDRRLSIHADGTVLIMRGE